MCACAPLSTLTLWSGTCGVQDRRRRARVSRGMMHGHVTHCPVSHWRPAPILSTPSPDNAPLSELPITFGHPFFSATHGFTRALLVVPSPTTTTHFQMKRGHLPPHPHPTFGSVWVTSGPDGKRNRPPLTFPFSSSLLPACIPSLCFLLGG